MNYLYIICLALSSLFTYKPLSAETHPLQYAFFIPGGAFQQNTRVQDIRLMKPRYAKPDEESESSAAVSFSKRRSTADFSSNSVSSSDVIPSSAAAKTFAESPSVTSSSALSAPKASEPQYTLPVVEKKIVTIKKISANPVAKADMPNSSPAKNETAADTRLPSPDSTEIASKLQKYKLDENITVQAATPEPPLAAAPDASPLEQLHRKSLNELIQAIPYPDAKLPKFKQRYALYGLEMRVLQRRGKFPANPEQEEALAKADSLQRFEVK